jgi:Zn-dependent protease with chaperone function
MNTAEPSFSGIYADGRSTATQPVLISSDGFNWQLHDLAGTPLATHAQATTRISDPLANVPRLLIFEGGSSLESDDFSSPPQIAIPSLQQRFATFVHVLEGHAQFAVIATALVIVLLAAAFKFGLPALAQKVATSLPAEVEAKLGQAATASLDTLTGPSRLTDDRLATIASHLDRLLLEGESKPTLLFRDMGSLPNAFALPGNIILVTDALVYLLNDDEIAAVLTHEIGHAQSRHAEQQLLLGSTSLLLIAAATGDLSILTSFATTLPITLVQSGYSRDFEREADLFAKKRLVEADYDPALLADALRKLESLSSGAVARFSYLSTHPSNEERYQMLEDDGGELSVEQALAEDEETLP